MRTVWMAVSAALLAFCVARAEAGPVVRFGLAEVGNGIHLHYAEEGEGPVVIFVHGSDTDMGYWKPQVDAFAAAGYRAIAYSRRYDVPNTNPARRGYSAVVDAEDLVHLIHTLHIKKAYVIGHSYGALTALIATIRHPDVFKAVVLAEPPAISLLNAVKGPERGAARKMFLDMNANLTAPMRAAFLANRDEEGMKIFLNYLLMNPHAWDDMSSEDRADAMKNAREMKIVTTEGVFFPPVEARDVAAIKVPILVMWGGKTDPFLRLIAEEIHALKPDSVIIRYPESGHQMWYRYPEKCRADAETFFSQHP